MAIEDFFKRMDEGAKAEDEQDSKDAALDKDQRITGYKTTFSDLLHKYLPKLLPELEGVEIGFVENLGAYGDFVLRGKDFRIFTRMQPGVGAVVGSNQLVLALKQSPSQFKELGAVRVPRKNPIFPDKEIERFEREFATLLREELEK